MGTPTAAEEIPSGQLVPEATTVSGQEVARLVFDHAEAKGTVELRREGYGASLWVDGVELAYVDLFYRSPEGQRAIADSLVQRNTALLSAPDSLVRRNAVLLGSHADEFGEQGLLQYIRAEDGRIVSRTYDEIGLPIVRSRWRPIQDTDPTHVLCDKVPATWEASSI
jgi:hypothetical protein